MEENPEQTKILKEILKWIRFIGMKEVKEILTNNLSNDAKKLVYHYSDGSRGTKDFKDNAGIGRANTISDYWKEWKRVGIVEMISVKGGERGKKLFNLEDFGISIPETKTKEMDNLDSSTSEEAVEKTEDNSSLSTVQEAI